MPIAEERPDVGRQIRRDTTPGHREFNVRLTLIPTRRAVSFLMRQKQVSRNEGFELQETKAIVQEGSSLPRLWAFVTSTYNPPEANLLERERETGVCV